MQGKPAAAEASMTLQQPEVHHVFSLGKLSLDHRTLAVAAAQAPGRGGVDSDVCLYTGFLVAAAAALAFHARLCCLR